MADKKITELNSVNSLTQNDVFVVVTSSTGTPITKKIVARDIFKEVPYTVVAADQNGAAIAGILTSNVSAVSVTGTAFSAGKFVATLGTGGNTYNQYGLLVTSTLIGPTANVQTEHAAAKFVVDVSNTTSTVAGLTSALIVGVTNTVARVANTTAFIDFREASNITTQSTKYLFVASGVTQNTSTGNALVMFTNAASSTESTATHKLKVKVNGTDYWILLADTAT